MIVFDAHCHFHLNNQIENYNGLKALAQQVAGFAFMSTQEQDWSSVKQLSQVLTQDQGAVCSYMLGIHPWFAHLYTSDNRWFDTLEALLLENPNAGVGEIGLDKKWITPDTQKNEYQAQLKIFHQQLALAAKLQRPVSIHCVHAQGDLFKALRTAIALPPKIYLHAFGGAAGTVEQLVKDRKFGDRLYFGFASCVNLRSPKTRSVIAMVPRDRLLLESDRSSAENPQKVFAELMTMLKVFMEVKSFKSIEKAASCIIDNSKRFYSLNEL